MHSFCINNRNFTFKKSKNISKGYILISRVLHSLLTHSSRCLSQEKTFMTGSGLCIIWLGLLKQSRASLVAQMLKNLPTMLETWSDPWVGKIPPEEEMETHSSILAWRIHGQRNLAGYSPWVTNNQVSPLLPETQITHISVNNSVPSTVLLC